jgi:organic radical activating enzyme
MKQYPRQLMIELSRKCNLHCSECYHEDKPEEISLAVFDKLITNIARSYKQADQPLPILCPWFYSEPLLTPQLAEYLKRATSLGYKINLTTNGTIDQWDKLAVPEIDYHLVVLSIDGHEPQTYQAIRNHPLDRVLYNLDRLCHFARKRNLDIPICVKLTNKGIEWAEIVQFIRHHLSNPMIKMVAVSKAFNDQDGLPVARHECRYLSEFFIIQHDLKIAPCCMRWKAIEQGVGKVNVDDPMDSFDSLARWGLTMALGGGTPAWCCDGCQSAYTGEMVNGTVDGEPFGKSSPIRTKQDFYNTFYFNEGAI